MTRGFLVAVLLTAVPTLVQLQAEPLDAATCGQLKGEQARLEQTGVRTSMARGPAWAKANLAADKLDQIRRLMDLDEKLLFRCSARNLVELPPDADADPPPPKEEGKDAASKGEPPAAAAKNGPAAAEKSPESAKVAPAPQKTAPAKKQDAKKDAAPAEKLAKPNPKPKPKVDDAYKPPPVNPNVDPFASQPARQ